MTTKPNPTKPMLAGPLITDPDLVDRIFDYIVEQLPELRARVPELQAAVRAEFQGEEVYVPSKSPTDRQRLVAEVLRLFNGRNATEVARRLQISRASVYRWVKQAGRDEKPSQLSGT